MESYPITVGSGMAAGSISRNAADPRNFQGRTSRRKCGGSGVKDRRQNIAGTRRLGAGQLGQSSYILEICELIRERAFPSGGKGEMRCPSPKPQLNVLPCRHLHAKRLFRRFDWQRMPGTLVIRKRSPWLTQLTPAGETARNS